MVALRGHCVRLTPNTPISQAQPPPAQGNRENDEGSEDQAPALAHLAILCSWIRLAIHSEEIQVKYIDRCRFSWSQGHPRSRGGVWRL
jgi:hypothetical protein